MLIRDAEIVNAGGRRHGDIRCREGVILQIEDRLTAEPGEEEIDAGGRLVLPGAVDPHVHLALEVAQTRSADDFLTGTRAAIAGGTTTILDFVHPREGQDYLEALSERREEASTAVCDWALHMAVSWWGEETAEMMRRCVQDEGVTSFKAYTAYQETVGIGDAELCAVMEQIHHLGALLMVHCEEDEEIQRRQRALIAAGRTAPRHHADARPCSAEVDAVRRVLGHARETAAEVYLVHLSCQGSVAELARARRARAGTAGTGAASPGPLVHGETCIHYLVLDDSVYASDDFEVATYVLSPPLRSGADQAALWDALQEGVLEVVSTDHCPFNLKGQKELGRGDFRRIPGGGAGIQDRLSLLWTHGVETGRIGPERFVELVSTAPARLFGLYPRKGEVAVGSDADLVLWDPAAERTLSARTHLHHCDRSLYEGFRVRGAPTHVIAGGKLVYAEGELRVEAGAGRELRRRPQRS